MIFPDSIIKMLEPLISRRTWYRDYYLHSSHWRRFKKKAKKFYGNKCSRCYRSGEHVIIDVHHKTYERIWHERLEDVDLFCRDCHKLEHK
jgi:hypothetical protein